MKGIHKYILYIMKVEGQSFRRAMLGFSENCFPLSHFFEHLVPVGGALWRGYRTLRRWSQNYIRVGRALRVCNLPVLPCCFLCAIGNVASQLPGPAADLPCLPCGDGFYPSETISQDKLFLKLHWSGYLITVTAK